MPKISVIIPVYNAEPYLAKCLDSVINQTLKDIEIICVNDGSSDNSLEILKEYANKDERIKLITKPNSGYGHTMNVGFDNSTGEYIGIVEPDDYIKLDMYESLYEKAVEFDVDFAKADFYYWWSNEDKLAHYNCVSDENLYEKTIENFYDPKLSPGTVANWAGIYKRDFLAKNNIRHLETPGASYQDQGFYYSVIFNAKKAYYLNTPFYYYRQDNMASSVNSKDKIYCIFDEYVEIEKKLSEHPDKAKFNKIVFLKKYNSCNWNYRRINKKFKKSFYKRMCEEFALSYYYGDVLRQNFEIEQ